MDFQEGLVIIHGHDLGLDGVYGECLVVQRGAVSDQVLDVKVPVGFEEMKKGEDKGQQTLTHAPVLRLELLELGRRGPEEDLLDGLTGNHRRQLRGDVQAVPNAAEVVEVDVGRVGCGIQDDREARETVRNMVSGNGGFIERDQGME